MHLTVTELALTSLFIASICTHWLLAHTVKKHCFRHGPTTIQVTTTSGCGMSKMNMFWATWWASKFGLFWMSSSCRTVSYYRLLILYQPCLLVSFSRYFMNCLWLQWSTKFDNRCKGYEYSYPWLTHVRTGSLQTWCELTKLSRASTHPRVITHIPTLTVFKASCNHPIIVYQIVNRSAEVMCFIGILYRPV